ncbi:hypothetical protein F2Q69_00033917 [Brassica cretica]|uniref:Uncharacterized protein n=1 Tax=Brassica cretica TaxID=69181 RepID=A0A8S9SPX2_BRACR|nr:hypothetical protein F2Q69_00033917 [Brassica cretica]
MNLELRHNRDASWLGRELAWNANGLRLETRAASIGSRAVLDVDTSWNRVVNGLGFVSIVGFGLGFQSKTMRIVSVREGASVIRSTSGLH